MPRSPGIPLPRYQNTFCHTGSAARPFGASITFSAVIPTPSTGALIWSDGIRSSSGTSTGPARRSRPGVDERPRDRGLGPSAESTADQRLNRWLDPATATRRATANAARPPVERTSAPRQNDEGQSGPRSLWVSPVGPNTAAMIRTAARPPNEGRRAAEPLQSSLVTLSAAWVMRTNAQAKGQSAEAADDRSDQHQEPGRSSALWSSTTRYWANQRLAGAVGVFSSESGQACFSSRDGVFVGTARV